jgi:hypothetical protein
MVCPAPSASLSPVRKSTFTKTFQWDYEQPRSESGNPIGFLPKPVRTSSQAIQNPSRDIEVKRRTESAIVLFLKIEPANDQLSVKAVHFRKTS